MEEPDVAIVSGKEQVVIPAYLENKLGIKPRSRLLVYGVADAIILKKLTLPDIRKETQELWREVDKKITKYGEMTEEKIQAETEKCRSEKRAKSK